MQLRPSVLEVLLSSAALSLFLSRYSSGSFTHYLPRIFAGGLLIYTAFWSWLYPIYLSPLRKIPTVSGFPLWGQFYQIITEEVGVPQRQWHIENGPIVRYFFPFGSERLSIADNDALKHMTVRNAYNYPKPVRAKLWMLRILGEGVLLAEGDEHVRQRKILNPAFSTQSIKDLTPVFWAKAMHLSDLWQAQFTKEINVNSFEVLDWLNRTTLDIIGQAAFGSDVNSLDHSDTPLRQAYRMVFSFDPVSHAMHGLQAFFPASKRIPSKMNQEMEASRHIIVTEADRIVESKYQDMTGNSKDIMSLIVKQNEAQKSGEEQISFERMRDQIMTFLGAGHDTTATGAAWTLHLLAKYPDVQQKLRAEIKEFFPDLFSENRSTVLESWQDFDVDRLPYLANVCNESLRFIPPIPMTVRESKEDDQLGGYFVPKGTTVYVLANTINRLPEYWGDDADTFRPDRWANLPSTYTQNAFMTFLQGTRSCIGRKFAETELKIILTTLLSLFQFETRDDIQDPEELKMWRLVLRPRDGITLKATLI